MKRIVLSMLLMFAVTLSFGQSGSFDEFRYQDKYYLNLQFNELPNYDDRASLEGIEFLNYIGNNTYFCAISDSKLEFWQDRNDFSFVLPKEAAEKLTLEMGDKISGKSSADMTEFTVQFVP